MGARLEDYEKAAPYKSFLHVDQFSGPEELAKFLHRLDQDDNLYNEYFQVGFYPITFGLCLLATGHWTKGHN